MSIKPPLTDAEREQIYFRWIYLKEPVDWRARWVAADINRVFDSETFYRQALKLHAGDVLTLEGELLALADRREEAEARAASAEANATFVLQETQRLNHLLNKIEMLATVGSLEGSSKFFDEIAELAAAR